MVFSDGNMFVEKEWAAPKNAPSKYHIEKLLGKGAYGQAWVVTEKSTGEIHVMKEVRPRSNNELQQALLEAENLFHLNHKHIVRYKDAFVKGKSVFIIMEYAPMGDLLARIEQCKSRRTGFSEDQIMKWFIQVCLALRYIHGRGMVHRDVKSANCFIDDEGNIKLGDFGSSRTLEASDDGMDELTCKTPVGTPMYMAPELCKGQAYGQKADVWALGCLLYELLTLRPAFYGSSLQRLAEAIKLGQFDSRLPERFRPEMRDLCLRMLQTQPHKRPSVSDILQLSIIKKHMDKASDKFHDTGHTTLTEFQLGSTTGGATFKEAFGSPQQPLRERNTNGNVEQLPSIDESKMNTQNTGPPLCPWNRQNRNNRQRRREMPSSNPTKNRSNNSMSNLISKVQHSKDMSQQTYQHYSQRKSHLQFSSPRMRQPSGNKMHLPQLVMPGGKQW
eukprot:m.341078 g.341078  ORF g.341078 m.341078 type:complete len:445 (+) comp19799_c0_seq1:354-1688(+)